MGNSGLFLVMGNAGFLSSTVGFAHDSSNVLDGSLAVSFSYVASTPLGVS